MYNDESIVEAGALPPLLDLLRHPSAGVVQEAARVLGNLTWRKEVREEVTMLGALPPLVRLLQHSSAGMIEKAVRVLKHLADNNARVSQMLALDAMLTGSSIR